MHTVVSTCMFIATSPTVVQPSLEVTEMRFTRCTDKLAVVRPHGGKLFGAEEKSLSSQKDADEPETHVATRCVTAAGDVLQRAKPRGR